MVLQRHVLDLERQKLAVALAAVQNVAGTHRVHVHLQNRALAERDDRIADAVQIFDERRKVERFRIALRVLQPQQKLGAVAVLQHAVRAERVEVRLFRFGVRFRALHGFAGKRAPHAFEDVDESRAAGIDHARLAQNRQKFRRAFKRALHFAEQVVEIAFERRFLRDAFIRKVHAVPEDGQDRALDGDGNRLIRFPDAAFHRTGNVGHGGLGNALEALVDAGKDTGKDDARISARALRLATVARSASGSRSTASAPE